MTFSLSPRTYGLPRSAQELSVIHACEEVFIAFCDLMDQGEVDAAIELHVENHTLYDAGRSDPMIGKEPMRARMKKVRFSYPGRRTLHTPSNFRFHEVNAQFAECHVVISLFDLVLDPQGRGIGKYSTELLGYANEDVKFAFEDGRWKFHTRRVAFLAGAKRLPIGTLPGSLPWNE